MTTVRYFRNCVFIFGLVFSLTISSCATAPKLNQPKRSQANLEKVTNLVNLDKPKLSNSQIRKKLNLFRKSLQKGKLTQSDWKLHDQLLGAYIELKQRQSNKIKIPAQSKLTLSLETYCLNSGRAPPSKKEIYHWQKSSPGIKYYRQLLEFRRKGEVTQNDLQELLWNLENETRWDDYPNKLKAILQKVDPKASYKLPSALKDQATSLITDTVLGLPGASEAFDTYNLVKGQYYTYEDFKKSVESLTSKHELSDYKNLTKIPDTEIYSQSESNGFDNQNVTFYNPTDKVQEIDLNEYYLAPKRKDVQRIGVNQPSLEDPTLLSDLEKTLYEDMARLGLGFTPIVNDIVDIYELLAGKDFVSGDDLSFSGRVLSGIGVIAGSGASYRYAKRTIHSPPKYFDNFSKGINSVAKKDLALNQKVLVQAEETLKKSKSFTDRVSNLEKHSPINPGYLHNKKIGKGNIADTFRSSTYLSFKNNDDLVLYRVQSRPYSKGDHLGSFWTKEKPLGPIQSTIDSALDPTWGNSGKYWIKAKIPKGTQIFEGRAASQKGFAGGGSQVFVEKTQNTWVVDSGVFK